MQRIRIRTILVVIAAIALPMSWSATTWKAERQEEAFWAAIDDRAVYDIHRILILNGGPSGAREYVEHGLDSLTDSSDGGSFNKETDLMSVNLTDPLVSEDEIPVSRRFRLSDDPLRLGMEAGIFEAGAGPDDRISLDQYHQLGELGILNKSDRVELLGGWLVAGISINPTHRISTRSTRVALENVVPRGWYVDQNAAVTLPISGSEPEPDVQVVRGDSRDLSDRHPGPQEIGLLMEISDSSLSEDRGLQKRLYATNRVAGYWIVNLRNMRIEVYTEPSGPGEAPNHGRRDHYLSGDVVPVVLDGREIARIPVSEIRP